MANLTELATQIIAARASKKDMTKDEFLEEMQMVYSFLKGVEDGCASTSEQPAAVEQPRLSIKQAFKKDQVFCLICSKGFKTLKRHLSVAHNMKPGEYRKQFNIPSGQSLVAKAYSEQRKKDALDRGQGEILAKARAVRASKKAQQPAQKEAPKTAKKSAAKRPAAKINRKK